MHLAISPVVLGAGEPLLSAVEGALPRFVMPAFAGTCRLALAELQEDAVPVGALFLARGFGEGERTREPACG